MPDEPIKLTIFDINQMAAAGAPNYGWWKCMDCGGFAGFESSPTASAVTPWCRNTKHKGQTFSGYTLVFDPVPEEVTLSSLMAIKVRQRTQAEQDALDLRDVLWVVDIFRCWNCERMGIRPGYICVFCGADPSDATTLPALQKKPKR